MNQTASQAKILGKTNDVPTSSRRRLFKWHSWVGFHLAFIMSIVLATGTIATVSNEIDWLIHKELRVTPAEKKVSWQTMTDAIQIYSPKSAIISLNALDGDYLPYRASTMDEHGFLTYTYVNQWTGKVTGTTSRLTVQRFFRDLHRYLFMPNFLGLPIVTSMAFILLISLYTGLKTSRNWKTLMTRIRVTKGIRVLIGDAHKFFGLWSMWYLVLMAATSIWYLAEFGGAVGGIRFEPNRPDIPIEQLQLYGDVIESPSTDNIINAAKTAFPELAVTDIRFPTRANQAITVLGKTSNPLLRSRANRVFINPQTLEPIKVQRSENISWIAWLNEIADPLHFGSFGGFITKIIWFVFGVALTSLSFTGVWLTWKRTKTKAISKAQFATMPVLFIGLLFAYFWWYQRYVPIELPLFEKTLTSIEKGRISVTPKLGLTKNGSLTGSIHFIMNADSGRPNLANASIELQGSNLKKSESNRKIKVKRLNQLSLLTFVTKPKELNETSTVTLDLTMNSNETLSFSWSLLNE